MLRIKLERLRRNLNQTTIGRRVGIPQPIISQIETGTLRPTAAKLQRLADLYRVPPDDLLKEVVVLEPWR